MTDAEMTERELRAMVRESIARVTAMGIGAHPSVPCPPLLESTGASHRLLPLLQSGDDDGMCLIEPTVRCNHCGYCLSYGH